MRVVFTERERTVGRHALASAKKVTEKAVTAYTAASLDALKANAQLGDIAGAETKIELPSATDEAIKQMDLDEGQTVVGNYTSIELIELHRNVLVVGLLLDQTAAEAVQKAENKELVSTDDSDKRIGEIAELLDKLGYKPPQVELSFGTSDDDVS